MQTPGCIQAHHALLVLCLGDLQILQASENTHRHLGEEARPLLGKPVPRVIGKGHAASLHDMPARAGMAALGVCLHTSGGVAVLEFEGTGRTECRADDDFFMLVKALSLQAPVSVRAFCQQVTEEVRAITGRDRVMAHHCSRIAAMIFSTPPQFEQCSMSISNTRLSNLAQLRRTALAWFSGVMLYEVVWRRLGSPNGSPDAFAERVVGELVAQGVLAVRDGVVFDA